MIFTKRIALFIAPWCFVWLIAVGCSRQEPAASKKARGTGVNPSLASAASAAEVEFLTPDPDLYYRELAERYTDPVVLRAALTSLYERWGKADGEAAVSHALSRHRTLAKHALAGWIEADPEAPREWVLAQGGSDRQRLSLAGALLHALPAKDHAARGRWVANFAEESSGLRLVSEVAIGWGRDRPQDALDWLIGLPDGRARTSGIDTVFRRWAQADPEAASTHLTLMPAGAAKDLAISSLAKAIHEDDPEAARLWAETIGDDQLRQLTSGLLNKLAASSPATPPEEL